MVTQIQDAAFSLQEKRFTTRVEDNRIYLLGYGEDITAYLVFNNPASIEYKTRLQDTELTVLALTNYDESGHEKIKRRKEIKLQIMRALYKRGISFVTPCNTWDEVIL